MTVEDETDIANIIVFHKIKEMYKRAVKYDRLVIVSVRIRQEDVIARSVAGGAAEIAERDTLTYQPGANLGRGRLGMDSRLRSAGKGDELKVKSRDFR